METKLLQAHLEAIQGGEEITYLAATHVRDTQQSCRRGVPAHRPAPLWSRSRSVFNNTLASMPSGTRTAVTVLEACVGVGEQVQPERSHMPAYVLPQVLMPRKDRFQTFGQLSFPVPDRAHRKARRAVSPDVARVPKPFVRSPSQSKNVAGSPVRSLPRHVARQPASSVLVGT